ncbi:hypothetical protein Pcinc_008334 [Petrolisthes cinctipes]|uniref:Ig-like domain-containing protein n=1 Tax=Petrolisthes cinctipes TaxID=88211 RepID=A0AAE1G9B8_PETCI|nr:hypothetical protein Pcinc_008334 [Petrolisthes cinctipes]
MSNVYFESFQPHISVPTQLVGAPVGTAVTLECKVAAFPNAVHFWRFNDQLLINSSRQETQEIQEGYTTTMKLSLNAIKISDFGTYICAAKNSLGETESNVRLYEINVHRGSEKKQDVSSHNNELVAPEQHKERGSLEGWDQPNEFRSDLDAGSPSYTLEDFSMRGRGPVSPLGGAGTSLGTSGRTGYGPHSGSNSASREDIANRSSSIHLLLPTPDSQFGDEFVFLVGYHESARAPPKPSPSHWSKRSPTPPLAANPNRSPSPLALPTPITLYTTKNQDTLHHQEPRHSTPPSTKTLYTTKNQDTLHYEEPRHSTPPRTKTLYTTKNQDTLHHQEPRHSTPPRTKTLYTTKNQDTTPPRTKTLYTTKNQDTLHHQEPRHYTTKNQDTLHHQEPRHSTPPRTKTLYTTKNQDTLHHQEPRHSTPPRTKTLYTTKNQDTLHHQEPRHSTPPRTKTLYTTKNQDTLHHQKNCQRGKIVHFRDRGKGRRAKEREMWRKKHTHTILHL